MSTTREIAEKFIEFYNSKDVFAKYKLYSENCVSVEFPSDGQRLEIVGLDNIKNKHKDFYAQFDVIHSKKVSKPLVADHAFSIVIEFDIQRNNKREIFSELCIFYVKNGEIIKQEFIY